ncbi:hypothetical protein ACSHXN_10245 [Streptomyces sp. HUAS TT11]|uniref:hypothetical protein n=1 Tax=Streptomyces sp. HUAS TT11 TaxID=3447508 RepID=UPI003F65CBED
MREFADYLQELVSRLDQGGGWCGVFWRRDPQGMRSCLEGRDVPPWDVVESLLHDLAGVWGTRAAALEAKRAQALHGASLAAFDARPGGRDELTARLDGRLREQRYAAGRQAELRRLLESAGTREEAESLRLDLAWAEDDHERATARCAELRRRMEALDARVPGPRERGGPDFRAEPAGDAQREPQARATVARRDEGPGLGSRGPAGRTAPGPAGGDPEGREGGGPAGPDGGGDGGPSAPHGVLRPSAESAGERTHDLEEPARAPEAAGGRWAGRRPRGSARFAGVLGVQEASGGAAPAAPTPPTSRRGPRGARFAGAGAADVESAGVGEPPREPAGESDRRIIEETVAALARLRAEGRTGEAHALLVEAAHWPVARYPDLAAALHRAGLDADWTTLLWEAASLPAADLVAVADALTVAGRTADAEQVLRQGVVRPPAEIGEALLALGADGRHREVRALLDAYVRIRVPEEAVRCASADPQRLVPLLLDAARGVSDALHRDLVHALRVAGFTT